MRVSYSPHTQPHQTCPVCRRPAAGPGLASLLHHLREGHDLDAGSARYRALVRLAMARAEGRSELSELSESASAERRRRACKPSRAAARVAMEHEKLSVHVGPLGRLATAYLNASIRRGSVTAQTARTRASYVQRYLQHAAGGANDMGADIGLLCNKACRQRFLGAVTRSMSGYSARNHALAVAEVLNLTRLGDSAALTRAAASVPQDTLALAQRSWEDAKRLQDQRARRVKRQKMSAGDATVAPLSEILDFLRRHADADAALSRLEASDPSEWRDGVPDRLSADFTLATAVGALIIMLHSARLCVALNLTRREVDRGVLYGGALVVRVARHKTASSHGAAALGLRPRQAAVIRRIAELRARLPGGERADARVLVTTTGGEGTSRDLLRPFLKSLRRSGGGGEASFTAMRRLVQGHLYLVGGHQLGLGTPTAAMRSPALDAGIADPRVTDGVCQYLCHTPGVRARSYVSRSDAVVVEQARLVAATLGAIVLLTLIRRHAAQLLACADPTVTEPPSPEELLRFLSPLWPTPHLLLPAITAPLQAQVDQLFRDTHRSSLVARLVGQERGRVTAGVRHDSAYR